jgi:LPS-assembly protein
MKKLCAPFLLLFLWVSFACAQLAPEPTSLEIRPLHEDSWSETDLTTGVTTATNGVVAKYGNAVLTADKATINQTTGDIFAEGSVRVQKDNQTWVGEHVHYNFKTTEMDSGPFRTGKYPVFAGGAGLHTDPTNHAYIATNAFVTTDDYSRPWEKIRAKELKIVPGQYFEARQASLYVGEVPVFFFPFYRRSLGEHGNNFSFIPGYRNSFGPYMLGRYNWFVNEYLSGAVHADWREKLGLAGGPDVDFHHPQYGDAILRYYYARNEAPGLDPTTQPIPENRQRLYFSYGATLRTNFTVKSQVAYQSDPYIIRDFFEGEYRKDIQPNTFVEANQLWQNWSLNTLVQPRVNGFFETVERLPDVRLTGFRQQIAETPLYYDSESTVGYYRRLFSDTNIVNTNFFAARADTYHQITLPETFFGWLNFTPRVGGRFTYYSAASGPGATTEEHYRSVFNTGAEISTKASRVWGGIRNDFFDVDGLRHIIEPSLNYVYIPSPSTLPSQLPQFDYVLTNSLQLLPIEFPEFNSIDSIDSQNVIRYGLRNRVQTKRDGKIDNLADWALYMDWRLKPLSGQSTFSDIYSDLTLRPRSWLTFHSYTRYDVQNGLFQLSQQNLAFQPNDTWSLGLGYFYVRAGPQFGAGHNLISSAFFYHFNENWGARMSHYFEAQTGILQEQYYTLYRDLRSWTAALTLRVRDNQGAPDDFTVAVSFSLKAAPRFRLGQDTANPSTLVGY